LDNFQANILKSHGRDNVALIFLTIEDVETARLFLKNFKVSDALTQLKQTIEFMQTNQLGDDIQLLFLSRAGLDELGSGIAFDGVGDQYVTAATSCFENSSRMWVASSGSKKTLASLLGAKPLAAPHNHKEFIDKPNDGVGLLFMSYQASIEKQYHFMQSSWANNEGFPTAQSGLDPVIGETYIHASPKHNLGHLSAMIQIQMTRKKVCSLGL